MLRSQRWSALPGLPIRGYAPAARTRWRARVPARPLGRGGATLRGALQPRASAHETVRRRSDLETLTRACRLHPRSGAARLAEEGRPAVTIGGAPDALGGVGAPTGISWTTVRGNTMSAVVERLRRAGRRSAASVGAQAHRSGESGPGCHRPDRAAVSGRHSYPDQSMAVGRAASAVWADNLALPFLRSAVAGYRSDGRLTPCPVPHARGLGGDQLRRGSLRSPLRRRRRAGRGGPPAPLSARREACHATRPPSLARSNGRPADCRDGRWAPPRVAIPPLAASPWRTEPTTG
jgi:hypothetical protein